MQPYGFADHSGAVTRLHFDGEPSLNSSEWRALTQLSNLPLFFLVLLLMHGYLSEKVMRMGEASRVLWESALPVGCCIIKRFQLWKLFSDVGRFWGTNTPWSCKRKSKLQQKRCIWCEDLCHVNVANIEVPSQWVECERRSPSFRP